MRGYDYSHRLVVLQSTEVLRRHVPKCSSASWSDPKTLSGLRSLVLQISLFGLQSQYPQGARLESRLLEVDRRHPLISLMSHQSSGMAACARSRSPSPICDFRRRTPARLPSPNPNLVTARRTLSIHKSMVEIGDHQGGAW